VIATRGIVEFPENDSLKLRFRREKTFGDCDLSLTAIDSCSILSAAVSEERRTFGYLRQQESGSDYYRLAQQRFRGEKSLSGDCDLKEGRSWKEERRKKDRK